MATDANIYRIASFFLKENTEDEEKMAPGTALYSHCRHMYEFSMSMLRSEWEKIMFYSLQTEVGGGSEVESIE